MPPPQTTTRPELQTGRRRELAASTRAAYTADWAFFTDWCTAAGHTPLPATADTLIDFLDDNPAPPATWARRVAAIGHVHITSGRPSPTRDPAVTDLIRAAAGTPALDPHPRRLPPRRLEELLARIPTHGWPAGLHGRRDRLLLVLADAGLTRTQLHQLQVHQLTVIGRALTIHVDEDRDPIQLPTPRRAGLCPSCIWLRWLRVLDLAVRYPGNRMLRDAFHRTSPTSSRSPHLCHAAPAQPSIVGPGHSVFVSADQYGYIARDQPLTTRAITRILTTVTADQPPRYRYLTPGPSQALAPDPPPTLPSQSRPRRSHAQVHDAHREALARQNQERVRLAQLDVVFDNLNQQIDRLTADARRLAADMYSEHVARRGDKPPPGS